MYVNVCVFAFTYLYFSLICVLTRKYGYIHKCINIYSLSLCTKVLMCVHIYSTQNNSVNILLFGVLQFSRIFFDEFHITYNNHLNS